MLKREIQNPEFREDSYTYPNAVRSVRYWKNHYVRYKGFAASGNFSLSLRDDAFKLLKKR